MAPSTKVPSRPRFTRPDFSVRHSPSATNMKGVETRSAPPMMAKKTIANALSLMSGCSCAVACGWRLKYLEAAVQRLRGQQHDEGQALQHQDGSVRQPHATLDKAAGSDNAAEHDGDRDDGDRVMAGEKSDQNASKPIACDQRGIGAALNGGHFEEAGQTGAGAGNHAANDDELADRQPLRQRRACVAAGDADRKTEGGP